MNGLTTFQGMLAACALLPAGTALACWLRQGWFRPWMALLVPLFVFGALLGTVVIVTLAHQ